MLGKFTNAPQICWYSETSYVMVSLTLVSNNLNFSTLFKLYKIGTAFKFILDETLPKLSVNFGNTCSNSQDSHENQYQPVFNFVFYGATIQINHSSAISLPLVKHPQKIIMIIQFML